MVAHVGCVSCMYVCSNAMRVGEGIRRCSLRVMSVRLCVVYRIPSDGYCANNVVDQ